MEQILSPFNAEKALRAVEGNQGAPGIDGMRTEQLREHLRKHGEGIRAKLMAGTYVLAKTASLQTALSNRTLRRYGFLVPSDLATTM